MKTFLSILLLVVFSSGLFAFSDTDGDGMMDSWEDSYSITDPQKDVDGDGLTNLEEFIRQSDPTLKENIGEHLAKVKNIDTNGTAYETAYYKEYLLVADYGEGLKVYDKEYKLVSSLKSGLTGAIEVSVNGDYAYIRSNDSLKVVDLTDINNPTIIKDIDFSNLSKIYVKDDLLYLLGYFYDNGKEKQYLEIYDISNPKNPTQKSKTILRDEYSESFSIMVEGNIAYIAGKYEAGSYKTYLKIFDISNSSNPTLKGSIDFTDGGSPYGGIAKIGDFLYIGNGGDVIVANIKDITNPYFEKQVATSGVKDIKVEGNIAYMLSYNSLYIYDITYPLMPEELKSIYLHDNPYNLTLKDSFLFIPRGYYGVDIYDRVSYKKLFSISDDTVYSVENFKDDKIILGTDNGIKIYDLKAYDRDFDGVSDRFDIYPDDKSRFFKDSDGDGKIDELNPNTTPDSKIYHGYSFDDDIFHLVTTGQYTGDINLFLSSDTNVSISQFSYVSLFNKSNYFTSYYLYFDNFDSKLVSQLYNLSWTNEYGSSNNLINSTSKENNPESISLNNAYSDKLLSDNSGVDKRWLSFTPKTTGFYSLVILKEDGLSSLIKIDPTKEAKITAKIYEQKITLEEVSEDEYWNLPNEQRYEDCSNYNSGCKKYKRTTHNKELLGERVLDPQKFSSIGMPLEKNNRYFVSFELENIKQFKYKLMAVKEYEDYFEEISLDENGKATYNFIAPKSTTYEFVLNANKSFKSKLYLGTQTDKAHLLESFEGKFVKNTLGLRASFYTISIEGTPNSKVTFVLGKSDSKKEIEPNNTYQSATAKESGVYQATLEKGGVDFYKVNAESTFSVTISPSLTLSAEDISKYQFNLFVYNMAGDVVEKSYEYLEDGSITYNFSVGESGTYFIRFTSSYPESFDYTIATSGTSSPSQTQTELVYAQKFNSYILGRGIDLSASTQEEADNGELIILVGDANNPTDNLYQGSQKLSKNMYRRFLLRGLTHDDIFYLNGTKDKIDLENDGIVDDVIDDNNPTKDRFYNLIKDRAKSKKKGPLFIYMVDHGANGSFKIKSGDIVVARDLKKAIDEFISSSNRKVVVIIEACKSGSFIPTLTKDDENDILVITSSQAKKLSYIDKFGNVAFSKFFADYIMSGNSLEEAFKKAKEKLSAQGGVYTLQIPQISSGADEGLLDFRVGGDFAAAGMELSSIGDYFGKDSNSFDISTQDKNINLFVKINGSGGVNKVWATVIPPNYQPPNIADDSFETPDMTPYTVELKYNKDSDTYKGVYDKLEVAYEGEYSITYYIEDSDGNVISKNVKLQGKNIDSTLEELKNKPVFEFSESYIEVLLKTTAYVDIKAMGDYHYSISISNPKIATVSLNDNKISIKADDVGETNIIVTASNNGYTTKKEFTLRVKESEGVKKESINFSKGWSLIASKTVDGIDPNNIPSLISSWKYQDGEWIVFTNDKNLKQKIKDAGYESMTKINSGEGVWILTSNKGSLTQIGTPYNILGDDLNQKLSYGWNLVGSGIDLSIKNLYNKIASYGADIENIWAYRDGKWYLYTKNLFYLEKIKNDTNIKILDSIKGGEGFWIYVR